MFRIITNIKKYLVIYAITSMILAWILGVRFSSFAIQNKKIFSNLIVLFVFFMIYPMMINMNWGKMKKIAKEPKAVLLSLLYNYLITPFIAFILAKAFIHNSELSLGFMLVMLIPVSSSSVGYTGIVNGSVEIATVAQAINFLLIPVLAPFYLSLIAKNGNIIIPMASIFKSITIVIILPMILGYITRLFINRAKSKITLSNIKPYTSLTTLVSMLLIIFLIFFLKGNILIQKWHILIDLGIITLLYIIITLVLITLLNKKLGLSYKEHMGIVFLSTGKNNGTAVAIATMAFGPLVAIPAAVLPIFQIVLLIGYIHMERIVFKYFER